MAGVLDLLALGWVFGLASGDNSTAWFGNISTNLFFLPGDVVLGGLFPINSITSNLSHRLTPNDLSCERYSKNSCFGFLKRLHLCYYFANLISKYMVEIKVKGVLHRFALSFV